MDERLSRPSWLTYSGQFTHISGHPSAVDQSQDKESSLVKDQRSATVPCNQQASIVKFFIVNIFLLFVTVWNTPQMNFITSMLYKNAY